MTFDGPYIIFTWILFANLRVNPVVWEGKHHKNSWASESLHFLKSKITQMNVSGLLQVPHLGRFYGAPREDGDPVQTVAGKDCHEGSGAERCR